MTTYFVSGHLDLTLDEFRDHYAPRIATAISEDAAFVVGDARGCDLMAQMYLRDARARSVQVFHMLEKPRNNVGGFSTIGGFPTDDARDAAMTAASDRDIAWVRPGRGNSGTAANLARRYFKKP
jgi:hypothetical protein